MKESEFKFLGYRITKISFELADEFGSGDEVFNSDIKLTNNYSTENKRLVEVVMNINLKTESNNLKFDLTIKGGFQANEDMPEDLFQRLSGQNAPAILYPFARAIITSYTAQANILPIILPTVNFTKPETNS